MLRALTVVLMLFSLIGDSGTGVATASENGSRAGPCQRTALPLPYAETFKVFDCDGYRVVDLQAPVVPSAGVSKGAELSARVVLVADGAARPALSGEFAGATLVHTPVERIAVNWTHLEAILATLDATERIVAIGGDQSYNDSLRKRTRAGEIAQIGYGWRSTPVISELLAARPDVFFMVLADDSHIEHYRRVAELGIPVVPIFLDAEPSYMGPLDYVRLLAMFTGGEQRAEAFVSKVEGNVAALKRQVAGRPRKLVLSAWFAGGGRWMATVRNAYNRLLQDAGAVNVMARRDDMRLDDFIRVDSRTLLEEARRADCWIIRDAFSQTFSDVEYLSKFKAWRQDCLFATDGSSKPEFGAYDLYETGMIRPDLLLADLIGMLHPELHDGQFRFIRPDTKIPRRHLPPSGVD